MRKLTILMIGSMSLAALSLAAQTTGRSGSRRPDPGDRSLARVKELEAREQMRRLEETMDRLARSLRASEPYNAAKLERAFRESRRRLLVRGMDRVLKYLEEQKIDRALEEEAEVRIHLEDLLDILLEKDIDPRELIKHIRRMKGLLTDVDGILRDETTLKFQSDRAETAGAAAGKLPGDLKKLEDLIERERRLEAETRRPESAKVAAEMASEQRQVRGEAETLYARAGARTAAKADAGADAESGEPKRPGDAGRPAEPDAHPGVPELERQPTSAEDPPEDGLDRTALKKAATRMRSAEEALESGDLRQAQDSTTAARVALEEAAGSTREKLERLRARRDFKALKRDQDKTRSATDRLAERMNEPLPLVPSEDGVPGRSEIRGASTSMRAAAGQLGAGEAAEAAESQGQALERLGQARDKMEDSLERLQDALRDRMLAYLTEKFTRMLREQERISTSTRSLHLKLRAQAVVRAETRPQVAPASRKDRQLAAALAGHELDLALMAEDVLDLLAEDGTTLVFPDIVLEIKSDLERISALLSRFEVGETTQLAQKQVEDAIREILAALAEAEKNPPPPDPNQGRGSQSGAAPLLPTSAELKMVRSLQKRVNDLTRALDAERASERDATPARGIDFDTLAAKQEKVKNLLRQLARKVGER